MEIQQIQQVRRYIDIVFRGKLLIGSFVLAGLVAGLGYYLVQPKVYEASALLSYQQQKVSPAKMSPDVQARIRDSVSTLAQIITSRSSLEQIIENIGLYEEELNRLPMEDVVEIMREDLNISPSRNGDTFSITYSGKNSDKVSRVANTLAAKFIEENLKYREERASETFAYTQNELAMAKETLDRKEAVMRDYKLKYYNEMADQRANNLERLSSLQEQYQHRQDSIQDLQKTRVLIQDQIAVRKQIIEDREKLQKTFVASDKPSSSDIESGVERLARLKGNLVELQSRYTDRHPEVKILKRKIEEMEKAFQSQKSSETGGVGRSLGEKIQQYDQPLMEMQLQLKKISLNIDKLQEEKADLKKQIEKYEQWVEMAPVREAEWSALTREYGELKRHYDYLVAQNLQARSSLNLERKQKGSQFKIEDPARRPQKPIAPNFLKIMAAALLAGTGFGGGLVLLRAVVDSSFRDPSEIENFLEAELICTVPLLELRKEKRRKLILNVAGGTAFMVGCVAYIGALVYFFKIGRIVL